MKGHKIVVPKMPNELETCLKSVSGSLDIGKGDGVS